MRVITAVRRPSRAAATATLVAEPPRNLPKVSTCGQRHARLQRVEVHSDPAHGDQVVRHRLPLRLPFGWARCPSAVSALRSSPPRDPVNVLSGHSDDALTPLRPPEADAMRLAAHRPPRCQPQSSLSRIRIGSAPDSWGVWFPDDPRQVPWQRFLDEVADAGLRVDRARPVRLSAHRPGRPRARRPHGAASTVSAGTVFTGLHRGPGVWDATWEHVADIAALTRAMGAGHLVVIPAFWRDDKTGEVLEDSTLTPAQWRDLTTQTERLAHEVRERYGLRIVVHPHADTHIDTEENVARFLDAHGLRPGLPLPRHRALRVLRRRQRQAHRDVRRAHRLPPPQAGGPGDPGRGARRARCRSGRPWRAA